jgi:sugar fermentation stimulation protein A
MKWPELHQGKFLKRYKRFFCDVELEDSSVFTVHCPNTGSMRSILDQAKIAWFSRSSDPKRKLKGTLEFLIFNNGEYAMVNTQKANPLVEEYLLSDEGKNEFDYDELKREVKYGQEKSRIDFLLEGESGLHYIEVKSVTLFEEGFHSFPDSVSARGTKHLRELIEMIHEGHKATLVFMINRSDNGDFKPADSIDEVYGKTLREAIKLGLNIKFLKIKKGDVNNDSPDFFAESDSNLRLHLLQEIQ